VESLLTDAAAIEDEIDGDRIDSITGSGASLDAAASRNRICVARGADEKPRIPSRRIRGALLARARRFRKLGPHADIVSSLLSAFGSVDAEKATQDTTSSAGSVKQPKSSASTIRVHAATLSTGQSTSLIREHHSVAIERRTRTAAEHMLRTIEYVRADTSFDFTIEIVGDTTLVSAVLALLLEFNRKDGNELTLGANRSDGWGRLHCHVADISHASPAQMRAKLELQPDPFPMLAGSATVSDPDSMLKVAEAIALSCAPRSKCLTIRGDLHSLTPFLRAKDDKDKEEDPRQLLADGLRGVLRSHCERIVRSLPTADDAPSLGICRFCDTGPAAKDPLAANDPYAPSPTCLICALFGGTGRHAALRIAVQHVVSASESERTAHQIARDRFTRYAAVSSLRSPTTVSGAKWELRLTVDLARLLARDATLVRAAAVRSKSRRTPRVASPIGALGLLLAAINDLERGELHVGGKQSIDWGRVQLLSRHAALPARFAKTKRRTLNDVLLALGSSTDSGAAAGAQSMLLRALWEAVEADIDYPLEDAASSFLDQLSETDDDDVPEDAAANAIAPVAAQAPALPAGQAFRTNFQYVPVFADKGMDSIDTADVASDAGDALFSDTVELRHDRWDLESFQVRLTVRGKVETPLTVGTEWQRNAAGEPAFLDMDEQSVPASTLRGYVSSEHEAWTGSAMRVLDDQMWSRRRPKKPVGGIKTSLPYLGDIVESNGQLCIRPLACEPIAMGPRDGAGNVDARLEPTSRQLFGSTVLPLRIYITCGSVLQAIRGDAFWKQLSPDSTFSLPMPRSLFEQSPGLRSCSDATLKWKAVNVGTNGEKNFLLGAIYPGAVAPMRGLAAVGTSDVEGRLLVLQTPGRVVNAPTGAINTTKKYEIFLPLPAAGVARPEVPIPESVRTAFNGMLRTRSVGPQGRGVKKQDFDDDLAPYLPLNKVGHASGKVEAKLAVGDIVYFDLDPSAPTPTASAISYSAWWRYPFAHSQVVDRPSVHASFAMLPTDVDQSEPVKEPFLEQLPAHGWRKSLSATELLFGFVLAGDDYLPPHANNNRPVSPGPLAQRLSGYASRVTISEGQFAGGATFSMIRVPPMFSPPPSPQTSLRRRAGATCEPVLLAHYNLDTAYPRGRKEPLRRPFMPNRLHAENWPTVKAVDPTTEFLFEIRVSNTNLDEVAALCCAIRPSTHYRHMLGYGTPAGMGRCEFTIESIDFDDPVERHHPDLERRQAAQSSVPVHQVNRTAAGLTQLHLSRARAKRPLSESVDVKLSIGEAVGITGVVGPEAAEKMYESYMQSSARAAESRTDGVFRVVTPPGSRISHIEMNP